MNSHRFLPLLLIAVCAAQPAFAQINPFRGSRGAPLSNADITALTDATNRLLDQPQLATGATETWTNPQSGASGTVTAGNPAPRKGMVCRVVQYQMTMSGTNGSRNRTLTWCKTSKGWKIG